MFFYENIGTDAQPLFDKSIELLRTDSTKIGSQNQNYDIYHFSIADLNGDGTYDILDPDANLLIGIPPTDIKKSISFLSKNKTKIQPNYQNNIIQIYLPEPNHVVLRTFSLKGQLVNTHNYGRLQSGIHQLKITQPIQVNGQYVIQYQVGLQTFIFKPILP